jgi:hypothetical protein
MEFDASWRGVGEKFAKERRKISFELWVGRAVRVTR